jgi:hypothetical protein
MNAFTRTPTAPVSAPSTNVVQLPQRHIHREREFGVGYGNSSGYASNRRYANDWMQPRFRCA